MTINVINKWVWENLLIVIFFIFFTISLFLGDGKQPIVDVWWALGILMLYALRYYQYGKLSLRPLPRLVFFSWSALILFYGVRTIFSDSVGYSISSSIRLIEAYLLYHFFYSISSERIIEAFTKGLMLVGVVAILVSWVFIVFPPWASILPLMNLLYANYGHNHLVGFLLFTFPVVIGQVEKKRTLGSIGLFLLFSIGILLTFARWGWVLFIFYLLVLVWRDKYVMIRRISLLVALTTTLGFFAVSAVSLHLIPQNNGMLTQVFHLLQKPTLYEDQRWEYWRQSIVAIGERPWFGAGPGTFSLQAKRLQAGPQTWSWFAHSLPLQLTVETGIVGLALFLFLLWVLFFTKLHPLFIKKKINSEFAPHLLWGIILVFFYSLFEFVFDYLTMWLVVIGSCGILRGAFPKKSTKEITQQTGLVVIGVSILFLYYFSYVGSEVALLTNKFSSVAHKIGAYRVDVALDFINSSAATADVDKILLFHKLNPEVLVKLAQKQDEANNTTAAIGNYELTRRLDPYNEEYQQLREKYYLRNDEYWLFFNEYKSSFLKKHPNHSPSLLNEITFDDKDIVTKHRNLLKSKIKIHSYSYDYPSINFFLLGFALVDTNPLAAKQLFIIARNLSPNWSYFHLALSSYYHYYENQKELAQDELKNCLQFLYAKDHCVDVIELSIPTLEEIKDGILTIP